MEYELFRSKLKPLVDRTLIPNIIENSSSGEHPHHAVAMGLILESSIQERRERMSKTTNASQPDSTPKAEGNTEIENVPIRQALLFVAVPPKLTPSEPRKVKPLKKLSPPAKTTPSPSREHTVKATCVLCGFTGNGWFHAISCPDGVLKCDSCGTKWAMGATACANCHGKLNSN